MTEKEIFTHYCEHGCQCFVWKIKAEIIVYFTIFNANHMFPVYTHASLVTLIYIYVITLTQLLAGNLNVVVIHLKI